jgi:hypothetical protein
LALFVNTTNDTSFCVGVARRERNAWKTEVSSLGKHITTADAALLASGIAVKDLIWTLSGTDHSLADIVTESRVGLSPVGDSRQ